jgi:hypothetical protein
MTNSMFVSLVYYAESTVRWFVVREKHCWMAADSADKSKRTGRKLTESGSIFRTILPLRTCNLDLKFSMSLDDSIQHILDDSYLGNLHLGRLVILMTAHLQKAQPFFQAVQVYFN